MATSFKISSVDYANPASGSQFFTFEYKLWSDSSWTVITASVPVLSDGTISASPELEVTGLVDGELYYVRGANLCNSPLIYYIQEIQL